MKKIILGISLVFLLTGVVLAEHSDDIQIEELLKTTTSWDGSVLPVYPDGQPEITILRITIAPGAQLPMHLHPVINAGIVMKGRLTVETVDNKVLHLQAGGSLAEVVNQWHRGKNEGDGPVEIVVFYAGTKDRPVTVKKEK